MLSRAGGATLIHSIVTPDATGLPMSGHEPLRLRLAERVAIVHGAANSGADWGALRTEYIYTIEDARGAEVVSYHLHRTGPGSRITTLHLHIGPAAGELRPAIGKAHLPTGEVSLAEVLRFAIRDLAVLPTRDDRETILAEPV